MTDHVLKTWPAMFAALDQGKNFEVRRDDRDFRVGDALYLREYDPESGSHTGRMAERSVSYVLRGEDAERFGVQPGYCVLGLDDITPACTCAIMVGFWHGRGHHRSCPQWRAATDDGYRFAAEAREAMLDAQPPIGGIRAQ